MKKPYLIALILSLPFAFAFGKNDTLYPWTDIQGRTLQASFISLDEAAQIVTIKLSNGVIYPAPLNTLSLPSQALAKQLGAPPIPVEPKPKPDESSPFDAILASVPKDILGPEALDIDHKWSSADGRPLHAKFISLQSGQLTLAMNAGAKEFTIALDKFSAESQALAKLLHSLAQKHRAKPSPTPKPSPVPVATKQLTVTPPPSKPLPVPSVSEADLEKLHSWKNAQGNPLQATFISATDKEITLQIKGRRSPYVLPWNKLSAESQALGQALRKLKKSLVPTMLPANEKNLARFGSGKWKDYNTILESVAFEAGIYSKSFYDSKTQRHLMFPLDVWFVKDGVRMDETKMTLSVQPFAYSAQFDEDGKPVMRDGKQEWRYHRRWLESVSSPEVSTDRRKTSIEGILNNGSKFEFNYELSQTGVSLWGKVKDSSKEDYPTHFRIFAWSSSLANSSEASQMTAEQIKKTAGDGTFYVDLVKGRKLKFPFSDKFVSIKKKLKEESKGDDISIVKMVEYKGSPFGDHRARIEHKAKKTRMTWDEGYGAQFALQGIRMEIDLEEALEARKYREKQKKYRGIGEIGYGDRVQVKVFRGD